VCYSSYEIEKIKGNGCTRKKPQENHCHVYGGARAIL
jgi:hypothetical protein